MLISQHIHWPTTVFWNSLVDILKLTRKNNRHAKPKNVNNLFPGINRFQLTFPEGYWKMTDTRGKPEGLAVKFQWNKNEKTGLKESVGNFRKADILHMLDFLKSSWCIQNHLQIFNIFCCDTKIGRCIIWV